MKTSNTKQNQRLTASRLTWASRCVLAVVTTALAASMALAESVIVRSNPLRFTVANGVAATYSSSLTVVVAGNFEDGVNGFSLSVGGTIPGLTSALVTTNAYITNGTFTATLFITNDATMVGGLNEITVDAAPLGTNVASFRLPVPIECAHVWSGVDYTNAVSTNFASAGNWKGTTAPGANDRVVFKTDGAQDVIRTNVIITSDQSVQSIRFASDSSSLVFDAVEIQNGATLKITGPGFSFGILRDSKNFALGNWRPTFQFSGNGSLMVTNANAKIGVFSDFHSSGNGAVIDMRNLNSFVADVVQIGLGDYRQYPNYYTNGSVGQGATEATFPGKFTAGIYFAKTNLVKCSWVDPNNYNDPAFHDYAVSIKQDETAGTSTSHRFTMGISNAFFIDSINWAGNGAQGNPNPTLFNFNAGGSYALFRGIGGLNSKMSIWSQGDVAGPGVGNSTCRAVVDFTGGRVDALIERFYLGRYRTNITASTIDPRLTIGGTNLSTVFDINTAYLGCQDVINIGANTSAHGPQATLTVNSNATFKVNGDLHLGYTIAPTTGAPNFAEAVRGQITVNGGGILMASNILVGGVTKLSTNNQITVAGGNLFVTNAIGSADGRLSQFTGSGGGRITLLGVKVGETNMFVKKLNMAGSTIINIPTIGGSPTYPVTIPVISYDSTLPTDPALIAGLALGTLPSGVRPQTIVDNTANKTIDITFNTGAPNLLAWRGYTNNIWDTSTKNWVTVPGNIATNFVDGDSVIFDDNATGSTSISIPGTVIPGQIAAVYGLAMTNNTKNYSFSGGSVQGAATLVKTGTGGLTNDSSFGPGVTVLQGVLAGTGSFGSTILADGTTMTGFSGSISGGLDVSNATVTVLGTVAGGLTIRAGSLQNNGTISGTVGLADSAILNNTPVGIMNASVPWSIPTNSIVVNNGTIVHNGTIGGNNGLTVRGSLRGVGKITQGGSQASSDVRVTMEAGGSLMIGNSPNEITNMTIAVRLDFNAGSITTFDVDNTGTPVNDKINLTDGFILGKVNFGTGNGQGGSLVINKTAGPAFGSASILYLFDVTGGFVPDNANQAIPAVSPVPAPGLAWNVYDMTTNLTLTVAAPPFMTNSFVVGTNGSSYEFTWSPTNRGWRLERQISPLTVGLESPSTNWVTLVSSLGGSNPPSMFYPDTNDLSIRYFRSVQPVTTTNESVFYRLTYP